MSSSRTNSKAALEDFYRRIEGDCLVPLWERLADLLPEQPRVQARPYLWDYEALRPRLLESAGLIEEDEAERRVLILENPALVGESAATDTLFAGLQLMMAGERAPPHRHSPAALRFILESDNAYTTVNDERFEMNRGDVILTPSWCWHGHGHGGAEPVIWLDILDLPTVRSLGPRFAERREEGPSDPIAGESSHYLYGMNMSPVQAGGTKAGRSIRYPYERSREVLERLKSESELDPAVGLKMEYRDTAGGGSVLPTISAFLQLLPRGFSGDSYLSTESIVYCVVEGSGSVSVGADESAVYFAYKPNDIFVVPCWYEHTFCATEETVLFSASDRAVQSRLGLWRERVSP